MSKKIVEIKLLLIVLSAIILTSCGSESDADPSCAKWEVEINNPEATVKVENGKLIVDILNPKTAKDIRLIQRQGTNDNFAEIGAGLTIAAFETTGVNTASRDTQVSMSFAYTSSPNSPFIRATYGTDISNYYVNEQNVFSRQDSFGRLRNDLVLFAKGEIAAFERDDRTFPIPLISVAPKVFYLDFGVDSNITRQFPTKTIHIEIDIIIFGQYANTKNPIQLITGYAPTTYGLFIDPFDCNSLK
jgi:hypothetical protein